MSSECRGSTTPRGLFNALLTSMARNSFPVCFLSTKCGLDVQVVLSVTESEALEEWDITLLNKILGRETLSIQGR